MGLQFFDGIVLPFKFFFGEQVVELRMTWAAERSFGVSFHQSGLSLHLFVMPHLWNEMVAGELVAFSITKRTFAYHRKLVFGFIYFGRGLAK